MVSDAANPGRRVRDRVELNRKVLLRFDKFQDFLTELAGNISPGGMFVKSDEPRSPGEQFDFECSLADGFPLVSGRAEVVWVRRQSTSTTQPAGMGVRFVALMDESEVLVRRIVKERLKAGEGTFELDDRDPAAEPDLVTEEHGISDEILAASERFVEEDPNGDASKMGTQAAEEGSDLELLGFFAESPAAADPAGQKASSESEPFGEAARVAQRPAQQPRNRPLPPSLSAAEPLADQTQSAETPPGLGSPDETGPASAEPRADLESEVPPADPPDASGAPGAPGPAGPAGPAGEENRQRPSDRTSPPVVVPASSRETAPVEEVPESALPDPRARVAQAPRRRLGALRFFELVLFSLLAGVCMVLIFNQYWVRPRVLELEAKLDELTGSSRVGGPPGFKRAAETGERRKQGNGEEASAEIARTPIPEVAKPGPEVAPPQRERVQEAVQRWARAWSGRRVGEYFSFYSPDFMPASGVTRAVWEVRRRDRLQAQGDIRVSVVSMDVEELSPTEMRVTFTQSYQSDTFRDRVRKILRMSWQDDAWKIAEEIVVRQLPW